MTTQNYFIVENNIVTNSVVWNGNTDTWTPPENSLQLLQETTLAMVWTPNSTFTDWELSTVTGVGSIGFTWDGSVLTTNESKPVQPPFVEEIKPQGTKPA